MNEALIARWIDLVARWGAACAIRYEGHTYGEIQRQYQERDALAYEMGQVGKQLADALAQADTRERQAFEAGFQWCSSGTGKYGDYLGGPI